ncbi:MAG: regulatory protein RecX, partial [Chitinophagaceae bacterium]
AYQERCHSEVKAKLSQSKIWGSEADEIMAALITENYLNEERFARSFVRGKFRIKQWGRNKIIQALKQKQISEYCIRKGIKEIEEDTYFQTLEKLASDKFQSLKNEQYLRRKFKTLQFLLAKGYEADLINDTLKVITDKKK